LELEKHQWNLPWHGDLLMYFWLFWLFRDFGYMHSVYFGRIFHWDFLKYISLCPNYILPNLDWKFKKVPLPAHLLNPLNHNFYWWKFLFFYKINKDKGGFYFYFLFQPNRTKNKEMRVKN
jgi:hypothetical protein